MRRTKRLVACTFVCVAGLAAPAAADANRASDPRGDLLQGCTDGAPVVGTPAGFDLAGIDGVVSDSGDVTLHVRTYGDPARFLAEKPDSATIEVALRIPGHDVLVVSDERHLGVHRTMIAENNSPLPNSRVVFDYTFFDGLGLVTVTAPGVVTITGTRISGNRPVEVMGVKSFAMTNANDSATFVCDQMLDANLGPIVALATESTESTPTTVSPTTVSPTTVRPTTVTAETVAAAEAPKPANPEPGSGAPWVPIGIGAAAAGLIALGIFEWKYRRTIARIGAGEHQRFCPGDRLTRGQMAVFIIRPKMNNVHPTVTSGAMTTSRSVPPQLPEPRETAPPREPTEADLELARLYLDGMK